MKNPIDNQRKSKDIPTVSKQQFTAEYAAAVRAFWNRPKFTEAFAVGIIDGVIAGHLAPAPLLKDLAMLHGAKRGQVGNFLRGLK